eukprot:752541-Hanusia_phi.AAC.4
MPGSRALSAPLVTGMIACPHLPPLAPQPYQVVDDGLDPACVVVQQDPAFTVMLVHVIPSPADPPRQGNQSDVGECSSSPRSCAHLSIHFSLDGKLVTVLRLTSILVPPTLSLTMLLGLRLNRESRSCLIPCASRDAESISAFRCSSSSRSARILAASLETSSWAALKGWKASSISTLTCWTGEKLENLELSL